MQLLDDLKKSECFNVSSVHLIQFYLKSLYTLRNEYGIVVGLMCCAVLTAVLRGYFSSGLPVTSDQSPLTFNKVFPPSTLKLRECFFFSPFCVSRRTSNN